MYAQFILSVVNLQSFIVRSMKSFILYADVLSGYNGTIFAYGQTASGKTHTMEVCC